MRYCTVCRAELGEAPRRRYCSTACKSRAQRLRTRPPERREGPRDAVVMERYWRDCYDRLLILSRRVVDQTTPGRSWVAAQPAIAELRDFIYPARSST